MSVELNVKPITLDRKDNSVTLNWKHVFPTLKPDETFILQIHDDVYGWRTIHWGRKTQCSVENLAPCNFYSMRLKIFSKHQDSEYCTFKTATDTEQYYVKHLTRAIKYSKVGVIRKIITKRPQFLEIENVENRTPLMQATENNDLQIVNFLVNLGAKVNGQSLFLNRTALMMAVLKGYLSIASYLTDKGAQVNLKDLNGMNALHYAVDSENYDCIKFILEKGGDINQKDNQGWTPLIRAVVMEVKDDIIKLLLNSNPNYTIKDSKGLSFINHLELSGRHHIKEFLRNANQT